MLDATTSSSPNIPKDNTSEQIEEVLSCRCCPCMNCIEKHEIQVAIDLIRFIVGILSVVIFALGFSDTTVLNREKVIRNEPT